MNIGRSGRYLALILMMQFPIASFGQQQSGTPKKSSSRVDTVQLLDRARQLSEDARRLEPGHEIPLQARLADTVWPLDQPFAERLLSRSFELTVALLKEPAGVDSVAADPQTLFANISSIASRHDTKLEKKLRDRWQEASASVAEKATGKTNPTQLAMLLLTQAADYLKSDEQKARQLFRQSATLRVTQDHCFLLMNQRERAPAIADTLFSDTLEVLNQRSLADANEILVLSSYLFSPNGSVSYLAISGYNTANAAANLSALPKNPALAKRYLALLLAKVNANEVVPASAGYFVLKNLLPQYQILVPELLNDVYARTATLLPNVSTDDSSMFDDAHKSSHTSESEGTAYWAKRIEKAEKIDKEEWRDFEYFTILFGYLLPNKDFTRAALMVSRISNQDLKEKSADLMNLAELQTNLEKADTAVTNADCNKIKNPLVRVVALSSLGQAHLKQKATAEALHLLAHATGEANQIKDDQDRIQAKLMLAQLSLDLDSSVGLERAAAAFKEINKFSDFNMNRSHFSLKVNVYGLKNELPISSPAPSSLGAAVVKMCRVNCEETFQLAGLLEKTEMRLWTTYVAVRTGLRER